LTKILPKDYEEAVNNTKSLMSIKLDMIKMSNLAAFNPKNNNEVIIDKVDILFYI
jgi:hypothetical protein